MAIDKEQIKLELMDESNKILASSGVLFDV